MKRTLSPQLEKKLEQVKRRLLFQPEDEISAECAAVVLGCSRQHVVDLAKAGRLRAYQESPAGWWHIDGNSVLELLTRRINGNGKKNGKR